MLLKFVLLRVLKQNHRNYFNKMFLCDRKKFYTKKKNVVYATAYIESGAFYFKNLFIYFNNISSTFWYLQKRLVKF